MRSAPTGTGRTDQQWLADAVSRATANVDEGGGPFGAVVVRDGELLGAGQNRVTRDLDPTAHAEVVAIREACARAGEFALHGSTLYSSCEPCPMCLAAALWARVGRILYAADREDAARGGFDDSEFYELLEQDRSQWPVPVQERPVPGGTEPFDAWLAAGDRVPY
jgi:guanine deaminase